MKCQTDQPFRSVAMGALRLAVCSMIWGWLPGLFAQEPQPAPAPVVPAIAETVLVADGAGRLRILTAVRENVQPADAKGKKPAMAPETELRDYIRKISGAELEIAVAAPGAEGLYVGKAADFPWLNLEAEVRELGPEGFIIRSAGPSLLLVALEDKGVHHAVATFLQLLGCRWFFPGETWEVVPKLPAIRGTWNEKQSPSFSIHRQLVYGFGAYPKNAADKQNWDRRNRLGGAIPVSIGHAGHGLGKEDFDTNPELFAMRQGKRVQGSKPCYSHPEYIKRAVASVLNRAAGGAKMISMTPADGLGYCECPLCHEWAKGGKVYWDKDSQFAQRPDGVLVCITSESLFNCINEAARALREKYPDTLIGTYAYSAYAHPPSFKIEPNVFVQTTTAYRRTPVSLEEQLRMFKDMGVQSGIRGYWSVFQWDWDYPGVKGELALPQLVNNLRFYHLNGVRSLSTEMSCNWGPRGLGYYLGARLLWDVNEDPQALIADFYEKAFGPAAAAMESYYARWLGEYVRVSARRAPPLQPVNPPDEDRKPGLLEKLVKAMDELGDKAPDPQAFTRENLRAACLDLDAAANLVRTMPEYLARVNHLRLYAHYLVLRLRLEALPYAAPGSLGGMLSGEVGNSRNAILAAVQAETVFGARIMDTNMIHTRPLIGKAFHRRFKKYADILKGAPEWPESDPNQGWNKGFRTTRHDVPAAGEIEALWLEDRQFLGF